MAVKDAVMTIAEPVVRELGYELVEVEYVKEGPRWFLRIYLHGPNGISLDDCRTVNDALGPVLEAEDPVKTPYVLEVSSPGAERVLKTDRELGIFAGRLVKVTLREPVDGEQVHFGLLGPATAETLHVSKDGVADAFVSFARDNVKQIRLALTAAAAGK